MFRIFSSFSVCELQEIRDIIWATSVEHDFISYVSFFFYPSFLFLLFLMLFICIADGHNHRNQHSNQSISGVMQLCQGHRTHPLGK